MVCLFFIYTKFSNEAFFLYIIIIGLSCVKMGDWTNFSKYILFDWIHY